MDMGKRAKKKHTHTHTQVLHMGKQRRCLLVDGFLELLLIQELQDQKNELPTQGRHCFLLSTPLLSVSLPLHLCVCLPSQVLI
jgi:hypothetical protein